MGRIGSRLNKKGEAKLHIVGAVHTQSFVAAKKHRGAREPRSLAKEWAVQVGREAKEEGLTVRMCP
jgi:hypothetical protein